MRRRAEGYTQRGGVLIGRCCAARLPPGGCRVAKQSSNQTWSTHCPWQLHIAYQCKLRQTCPPVGFMGLWRHMPQHAPHILLHVDAARQANDAVQQRAPGRGWREVGRGAGQGRSTDAGSGSHACCSRAGSRQRAWLSLSRPPAVTPLHWSPAKWPNNPPHLTPISSGVSGVRGPVGDSSSPPATMVRQPPRSHSARMPGRWDAPTTPTTRPPGPLQGCGAGRQATL